MTSIFYQSITIPCLSFAHKPQRRRCRCFISISVTLGKSQCKSIKSQVGPRSEGEAAPSKWRVRGLESSFRRLRPLIL
uniref:Ovule protein n=1 Tax=Panagrellus redivivus TaxID=6233 RepID=A0A7E4VLG6_PANRE